MKRIIHEVPRWSIFLHREARGLEQVSDAGELEGVVARVLAAAPDEVAAYRQGKTKLMGFFVGQVMRETRGQANPRLVNEILMRMLAD